MAARAIVDWAVDYGDGRKPCTVPHAWRQDVDVRWEGPAVYESSVEVPKSGGWLLFEGVSYCARVFVNGELALEHHGIWDAFIIPLKGFEGKSIDVRVEVVKNGGATFPVKHVLSGFLPYVFNTFGGIWREVWLCDEEPDLEPKAPPCRVEAKGTKIFVDGKPFYLRGVLTWGWYPELGHPNPSDEEIRREVKIAKDLGFNTIKFCLWVPSHRYFEILEEEEMFAWLELPLWDPSPDPALQEKMFEEVERIVRQYRCHSNIVVWTCGCELSSNTTADFRKRLYEMVKKHTGAALVKDNSGSSEMYGGDLREYGDFYDFHPYCDLPFYPVVLDSLLIGPRDKKPILLGEFNDIDVHRDLARTKKEQPYWASNDPYLNDQGVRWEKPRLPDILDRIDASRFDQSFANGSVLKASIIRQCVQESVRQREEIAGYVITGWRDTPISTAGVVDDWFGPRDSGRMQLWNGKNLIFPIPSRKPPWVDGGNRPGWIDPWNHFEGSVFIRFGFVSETGAKGRMNWTLESIEGFPKPIVKQVGEGSGPHVCLEPNVPGNIGDVFVENLLEGQCYLKVQFENDLVLGYFLRVRKKPDFSKYERWQCYDPKGLLIGTSWSNGENIVCTEMSAQMVERLTSGARVVCLASGSGTKRVPFWRESAYEWPKGEDNVPMRPDWPALMSVSGNCAIDMAAMRTFFSKMGEPENYLNRIDTRTYEEAPILIRAKVGKGTLVATTLRPFGGLGAQPYGVMNNPAGAHLLEKLIELAEEG